MISPLAQIGLVAPDPRIFMLVAGGSLAALLFGIILLIAAVRRPRGRTWRVVVGILLLLAVLLLWAWIGFLGDGIRTALRDRFPLRRAWDLSTGNECARLGEPEPLPGLRAWGGPLEFTVALPQSRRLEGRARYVAVASEAGRIRRLDWISAGTSDPCTLAGGLLARLRLPAPGADCHERLARADPDDILAAAWSASGPATPQPHAAVRILPLAGRTAGAVTWSVHVDLDWTAAE